METRSVLSLVVVICAALSVAAAILWVYQKAAAQSRVQAVRENAFAEGALARFLHKGIPFVMPLGKRLLRISKAHSLCTRIVRALRERNLTTRIDAIASMLACVLVCAIAISIVQLSFAPLAALLAILVMLSAWSSSVEEKQHDCMREDLPDALRSMSSCFHAGFTLPQTFEQLQRETTGPLQQVFSRATQAMKTGRTAHEVLAEMRDDAGIPELAFVSVALEVQHESGGSMQHVLDATGEMLKSELELRRSLKVQTAQARLSARVVVAVTIGLVAVLMGLTEDFLGPFFSSVPGLVLLAVAISMQVLGIVLVRRMLNIQGA